MKADHAALAVFTLAGAVAVAWDRRIAVWRS